MADKNLQQKWPEEERGWLRKEADRLGVTETRFLLALLNRERRLVEETGVSAIAPEVPSNFTLFELRQRGVEDAVRKIPKARSKRPDFIGPPAPMARRGRPPKPRNETG